MGTEGHHRLKMVVLKMVLTGYLCVLMMGSLDVLVTGAENECFRNGTMAEMCAERGAEFACLEWVLMGVLMMLWF